MFLSNSKPHLSDNIFLRRIKAILFLTIEGNRGSTVFFWCQTSPTPSQLKPGLKYSCIPNDLVNYQKGDLNLISRRLNMMTIKRKLDQPLVVSCPGGLAEGRPQFRGLEFGYRHEGHSNSSTLPCGCSLGKPTRHREQWDRGCGRKFGMD